MSPFSRGSVPTDGEDGDTSPFAGSPFLAGDEDEGDAESSPFAAVHSPSRDAGVGDTDSSPLAEGAGSLGGSSGGGSKLIAVTSPDSSRSKSPGRKGKSRPSRRVTLRKPPPRKARDGPLDSPPDSPQDSLLGGPLGISPDSLPDSPTDSPTACSQGAPGRPPEVEAAPGGPPEAEAAEAGAGRAEDSAAGPGDGRPERAAAQAVPPEGAGPSSGSAAGRPSRSVSPEAAAKPAGALAPKAGPGPPCRSSPKLGAQGAPELLDLRAVLQSSRSFTAPRRSYVELSAPLLKFKGDKGYLHPMGIERLKGIPGKIYPLILLGDGRAGKSFLASRILGLDNAFHSSDTCEAVTKGIDIVVRPMAEVYRDARLPDLADKEEKTAEPTHMVCLDCEGGNNALAAIRTLVNVFGLVIGTEVIFVSEGAFTEASIQSLGAALAKKALINLGGHDRTDDDKRLVYVVNKCTLAYDDKCLEKGLRTEQDDPGRKENREIILSTFSKREFHAIPLTSDPRFNKKARALQTSVLRNCRPLQMGGANVNASSLCDLLQLMVDEMANMNEVSFPRMMVLVMDGFLKPLVEKAKLAMRQAVHTAADSKYRAKIDDPRPKILKRFNDETMHLDNRDMVRKARRDLEDAVKKLYDYAVKKNEALGKQPVSTNSEQRTRTGDTRTVKSGAGFLGELALTQQKIHPQVRTVTKFANGTKQEGLWTDAGPATVEFQESAFNDMPATVKCELTKKTPSKRRKIFALKCRDWQPRVVVVKEGHVAWWERERSADDQVNGFISFLVNEAVVRVDKNAPGFSVSPKQEWSSTAAPRHGSRREIHFRCKDVKQCEKVAAVLKANIKWAQTAAEQVSSKRAKEAAFADPPAVRTADLDAP